MRHRNELRKPHGDTRWPEAADLRSPGTEARKVWLSCLLLALPLGCGPSSPPPPAPPAQQPPTEPTPAPTPAPAPSGGDEAQETPLTREAFASAPGRDEVAQTLEQRGLTLKPAREVAQPFATPKLMVYDLPGGGVLQIGGYGTEQYEAFRSDAESLRRPDGPLGDVDWVSPPAVWSYGRTIIVYVGDDAEVRQAVGMMEGAKMLADPSGQPEAVACTSDADCVPAQCCHPTSCTSPAQAPDCSDVACTEECRAGTLDCGGRCLCVDGTCTAKFADLE